MDVNANSRVIVVLGMHRSGTSAITRALKVLGVSLGDRMMPPVEGNNPKGFFEDIDLNAVNIEVMKVLNSDWHTLAYVRHIDVERLRSEGLLLRAVELLRTKLNGGQIFGFKDPRVARLLPFWKEVFEICKLNVSYVLPVRHPLSVVKSLWKRDKLDPEKSYLLWLEHVIRSLTESEGARRVLVNFDAVMACPESQIERIAKQIDLEIDPQELASYKSEFLDHELRHSVCEIADLLIDPACPPLAIEVFSVLADVASDKVQIDSPDFRGLVGHWASEFDRIDSVLKWADRLNLRVEMLDRSSRDLQKQVAALSNEVVERDSQIAALAQQLSAREPQMVPQSNMLEEREPRYGELSNAVAKQGRESGEMATALRERDSHVGGLTQAVTERDAAIGRLTRIIAERESQIAQMTPANQVLQDQINELHNSTSWRITGPMRYVSRHLRGASRITVLMKRWLSSFFPVGQLLSVGPLASHLVPTGFDERIYLGLNPDVQQCGMDAAMHYLRHGRSEGRPFSRPELNILSSRPPDSDKATVLVVSHDASRTGAPILSLNLVEALSERYNVVVLLLGTGGLETTFQSMATEVLIDPLIRRTPQIAPYVIEEICTRHNLLFALVNSVESRVVLCALASHFVPTVSLLHEFASYTRPRHAFREAFLWSAEAVFSARVTMDNALAEYPDLSGFSVEVVPQGRCLIPREDIGSDQAEAERAYIARKVRPSGDSDDSFVILGAGAVQLRKGVELFLECASRVVRSPSGERCRFVWIGHGYNPDDDIGYSVYLADQLRRAGLDGQVVFVRETSEIEVAYQAADVFLLSSRLDPLPNVAIDAMSHGLPVVCFDKTTGIADFLVEHGLGDACVADYLDSYELARKILAMAESPAFRKSIGERCREASLASFRMQDYVSRLERLALSARDRMEQERADGETIVESDRFQPEFSVPVHLRHVPRELAVRQYVRSWASGIDRRKPYPGFHPGIYRERVRPTIGESDPFAAYLKAGQPNGLWSYPVISCRIGAVRSRLSRARVALHLHAYFSELLPEIISRLQLNEIRPDLFVSVKNEDSRKSVADALAQYKGRVAEIRVVPNRGRDIGPLLTAFGEDLIGDYDFVGHLHTKKSQDIKDSSTAAAWYALLLENLLGGRTGGRMADTIVARMAEDSSIGIVFPDDPNVVGWSANRPFAEPLAARLGLSQLPEAFNFPVGTMFWARSSVLAPFVGLNLSWEDYPEEPLPYDGSSLHAIERLFGLAPALQRLQCAVTYVPGVTR